MTNEQRHTHPVSDDVFCAVYDSPASLPGRYKWLTREQDVRKIEELLGMAPNTIGAPLWVSSDRKSCTRCQREINWLDIVSSALGKVHSREIIARVILGEQRFVNTEPSRVRNALDARRLSKTCAASNAATGPRNIGRQITVNK